MGAFDNGVLTRELTQLIESGGKHWVSEIESSRNILWHDQWQRVDAVEQQLRTQLDRAAATELFIFERFGETSATAAVLEQLPNIRERATSSYSRLSNLLLRVSEFQPVASLSSNVPGGSYC